MGLTATLKEFYIKTMIGMNSLVENLDLQDKWVEIAQNCRYEEEPGAVDKRPPVTYLNSTTLGSGAYGMTGLYRFHTSTSGVSQWIGIHDTNAYIVTDTGSGTTIRTGLTAGKRTSFVTYKDLLIASNGYDNPWVYDGDTTTENTYDTDTKILIHFDGVDGSTTDYTADYGGQTVSLEGTAQLDTAQKVFGTASLLLDGDSDYATVPDSPDWDFGAGDFTIDLWARFSDVTATQRAFVAQYLGVGTRAFLYNWDGANLRFVFSTDGTVTTTHSVAWSPTVSTWYHMAVVRYGNNLYFFVNGTQVGSTKDMTGITIANVDRILEIGAFSASGFFAGWFDEVRISKGIARWTANFTPPTSAYTNITSTSEVGYTWELGACKSVQGATACSLGANKAYYYAVGLTVSGVEYICGAVSNTIVTAATAKSITLSNLPFGPSGTTNRKLYRVEGGSATLKLLATMTGTACSVATTYTDTIGDVSLTDTMATVNDDMPKGAELQMHRERLFISRDPNSPNRIYYSDPWLPHFIRQTTQLNYMDINPQDGDEISGIPIQLGVMVCIKKNTIRPLHITSAVSGADPTTWYAEDPIAWNGSPAPWSITQTPYGIVFLGWDHWYLFNGAIAQPIIDEFDVKDILEADYDDTVGFYHKGIFMAAYTDKLIANQFHDRIMMWNFNRKTLSYDTWTSTTLSGPNCFASMSGETGELYFGDSQKAYIVKDKRSENSYRLRTKTECLIGTTTGIYIGGTESIPYMEIGSTTAASNIPDDIVIFWDDELTSPGSGWTEITSTYDGYFIKLAASSSTAAAVTHTHTVTGALNAFTPEVANSGDQSANNGLLSGHSHTFSGISSSNTTEPRHVKYRIFKSFSCVTTEFPEGAIVMWDQASPPVGWQTLENVGYYVKVDSTPSGWLTATSYVYGDCVLQNSIRYSCLIANTSGTFSVDLAAGKWVEQNTWLGIPISSTHKHTYSITSSSDPSDNGNGSAGTTCAYRTHTHLVSNTTGFTSLDTWELIYAQIHMIKKIGEADTWNGANEYVMCLTTSITGAPTGWTLEDDYDGRYLKSGNTTISIGTASNASHTHSTLSGLSDQDIAPYWGTTYYRTQCRISHQHGYNAGTSGITDASNPKTVTFPLVKFVLGKMKGYNAAILVSATGGTWTSPAMQINAESLLKMFWNEDIGVNDNILIHTRSGTTLATCTAAAWSVVGLSNPNGSLITSPSNIWFQYKIEFTAVDSTVTNPRIYFTDGYIVLYNYYMGSISAETSVNWKYGVGFRNFDEPMVDKIFKKIATVHEGDTGSCSLDWETENSNSATFVIDLTTNPERWDSFFPSTAFGKQINLTFTKNDLYDFRLCEVKGLYAPMPVIL